MTIKSKLSAGLTPSAVWETAKQRLPLVIVGGALLLAAIMVMSRTNDTPAPRGERAWIVDVQPVNFDQINPTLELFGSVQSPQDAELSAGIEATVNGVRIKDGASVIDGELLVVLDDRDAQLTLRQRQADILEIEAQIEFAKRQIETNQLAYDQEKDVLELSKSRFERAKELSEAGRLSRADFENSTENYKRQQLSVSRANLAAAESQIRLNERRAQLERAEALKSQAELNVERTRVTAPFGGFISDVQVSQGDRVRIGDALMRLQNPESIEVRTQVPAAYVPAINVGLSRGVTMPADVFLDGIRTPGELVRISGQTREGSGGVDSYIGFSTPPLGMRLGSTVRVVLQLPPEDDVIAVPAEAIYGRDRLYKLADSRMKSVTIERVGERMTPDGDAQVIVRSPELANDESVIVTKLSNAGDGLLVRIDQGGTGTAAAQGGRP